MTTANRLANWILSLFMLAILLFVLLKVVTWRKPRVSAELTLKLRQNLHDIDSQVSSWYFTELENTLDECYPDTVQEAFSKAQKNSGLPTNPLSTQAMRELGPKDPNSLGDFRYIPLQLTYKLSDGTTYVENNKYYLIEYVDWAPSDYKYLEDRLGKTRVFILEAGEDKRIRRPREELSPRMQKIYDMVVELEYESLDEAWTRLGYP